MKTILAADIGGTKTIFQLSTEKGDVISEQSYLSQEYASFDALLIAYIDSLPAQYKRIDSACFAVAGPTHGQTASVTNLPWQLDAAELLKSHTIEHIALCNDFEAVAHGIACLKPRDMFEIQKGNLDPMAARAVIGAGTGLGQALMIASQDNDWQVLPTEGGHADFAPRSAVQVRLLEYMMTRFDHVSYETILSGNGIAMIYQFLLEFESAQADPRIMQAIRTGEDAAALISASAHERDDLLAYKTMLMFAQIYAAQAANLALSILPYGGLYIAGGIAAKNIGLFQQATFIETFRDKGKMSSLMKQFPVIVILEQRVGVLGARLLAQRALMEQKQ